MNRCTPFKTVYVNSPASTSSNFEFLNGQMCTPYTDKTESVKVVVAIGQRSAQRNIDDWLSILAKKSPTTRNKSNFVITKEDWLNNGLVWVFSTTIFKPTPINIVFNRSPILESGFRIEIFSRDTVITREVPPSTDLSTGLTVSFEINWTIASNTISATPIVSASASSVSN